MLVILFFHYYQGCLYVCPILSAILMLFIIIMWATSWVTHLFYHYQGYLSSTILIWASKRRDACNEKCYIIIIKSFCHNRYNRPYYYHNIHVNYNPTSEDCYYWPLFTRKIRHYSVNSVSRFTVRQNGGCPNWT